MNQSVYTTTYDCEMDGKTSLITGRKMSSLTGCTAEVYPGERKFLRGRARPDEELEFVPKPLH